MKGTIRIGTSGWHYDHWYGPFYPPGLKKDRMLDFYRRKLKTVEINNSFYRLPEKRTFAAWRETAGEGFCFAVKAYRVLTHYKKLKDSGALLADFLDRAAGLGDALGPVLFQLPPHWGLDAGRLAEFAALIPRGVRAAFEFRDESWFDGRAYRILRERDLAFCVYDFDGRESPRELTADFVYIRLHGPGAKYSGRYTNRALAEWADAIAGWSEGGRDVYCYFDNDQAGYAAANALTLEAIVNPRSR
jgi:uncharacterized protein YecE (DUF72 family)